MEATENIKKMDLTLDSDAFIGLKNSFNAIIKETLKKMQKKDVETADITIKLSISYEDYASDVSDELIRMPRFEHKITSKMQVKSESIGCIPAGFELKYDEENDKYYLQEFKKAQLDMFD
ncbi:MAG: hypothetical protein ACI4RN_02670 [Oscillospiraceae bacterium]